MSRFSVEDFCLGPMFAAFAAHQFTLDADFCRRRDRPEVFDFHLSSHCRQSAHPDGLAHCLVQKGRDDSAVQQAWRSFICSRNRGHTSHRLILGDIEVQVQADGVGRATAEALILCGVNQRPEVFINHNLEDTRDE